jgi:hypothetical protein
VPGDFTSGIDINATYLKTREKLFLLENAVNDGVGKSTASSTKTEVVDNFEKTYAQYRADPNNNPVKQIRALQDELRTTGVGFAPESDEMIRNLAGIAREKDIAQTIEFFRAVEGPDTPLPTDFEKRIREQKTREYGAFEEQLGTFEGHAGGHINLEDVDKQMDAQQKFQQFLDMPFTMNLLDVSGPEGFRLFGSLFYDPQLMAELQPRSLQELKDFASNPANKMRSTIADGMSAWYILRDRMIKVMFNEDPALAGDDNPPLKTLPPHLIDLEVTKVAEIVDKLGSTVLESPNDRSTWASGLTTMAKFHYDDYLKADPNNVFRLTDRMLSPVFQQNLDTLKKDGFDDAHAQIVTFRSNVARDSLFDINKIILDHAGNDFNLPIEFNSKTGELERKPNRGMHPKAEQALGVMNLLLRQAKAVGVDLEPIINEEETFIRTIGAKVPPAGGLKITGETLQKGVDALTFDPAVRKAVELLDSGVVLTNKVIKTFAAELLEFLNPEQDWDTPEIDFVFKAIKANPNRFRDEEVVAETLLDASRRRNIRKGITRSARDEEIFGFTPGGADDPEGAN